MIIKKYSHFSIGQICDSGQCFRMGSLPDGSYAVIAKDRYLRVRQEAEEVTFYCTQEEFSGFWEDYFDLNTDYGRFIGSVGQEDGYLNQAVRMGSGIRILRQDLWEMIISFIISQQNNIKRIRKCIETLRRTYGTECRTEEGTVFHAFPRPEALAAASEEELRACGLGYRARYISCTSKSVLQKETDLMKLRLMAYPEARLELMKLCGVGGKVADCICLFSLHQLEAFPVDTHIRQALLAQYPQGFPFESFTGFEGVIQQYIFFYELHTSGALKITKERNCF